jgi:hypothetical protein
VERAWLQPKTLHILRYGGWLGALTLDELKRILSMLLRDEGDEATEAGLSAIADRLKSQPEAKDSLEQLASWSAYLERRMK